MIDWTSPRYRRAVLVGALIVAALVVLGPITTVDSQTYLRGVAFRPPLLPTLAAVLRSIFGTTPGLYALVAVQAAAGLLTCAALATALCEALHASWAWWLVVAALAIPQLQAARMVMSESLAYTAFCGALAHAIRALRVPRRGDIVGMAAYGAALLAARAQFVYCMPLVVGAALFFLVRVDRTAADRARTLAGLLTVALAAVLLQALYTLPRGPSFRPVPYTGIQLVIPATYVATPSEVERVRDPRARELAEAVYGRLEQNGWLAGQKGILIGSLHFGINYNLILGVYIDEFNRRIAHRPLTSSDLADLVDHFRTEDWVALDTVTLQIARDLLRTDWPRYAKLVARNIYEVRQYSALGAFFILVLGLLSFAAGRRDGASLAPLTVLVAGLWLVNAGFVALLEPIMTRYTFYFDSALLALVLTTMASTLRGGRASPTSDPTSAGA